MRSRPGARRGKRKRTWIAPGVVDQLLQVLRRHRRIDDQQLRQRVQEPDRRKIMRGIVVELGVNRRPDAESPVGAEQDRIAVGNCMSDCGGADMAAGARPVVNDHLLAEVG
jgi:hypothetical protein